MGGPIRINTVTDIYIISSVRGLPAPHLLRMQSGDPPLSATITPSSLGLACAAAPAHVERDLHPSESAPVPSVWQLSSTLIKLTLFKEYAVSQGIPWSHLLAESKQQHERDALHA